MAPLTRRECLTVGASGVMAVVAGCLETFQDPDYPTERVVERGRGEPLVSEASIDREAVIGRHWRSICRDEAAAAVMTQVTAGIAHDLETVSVAQSTSGGLYVVMSWTLSRGGNVISEPNVAFEELLAVTPFSVTIHLTINGEDHECQDAVFVEQVTARLE